MRIDVKKFLFVGYKKDKEPFLSSMQQEGIIHFIKPQQVKEVEVPETLHSITAAIKVLRGLPRIEEEKSAKAPSVIAGEITTLFDAIQKIEEQIRILRLEEARVAPFGDFSKEGIAAIEKEGNCHVQFFSSKRGFKEDPHCPEEALFIASDHGLDYFMAVSRRPLHHDKLVEMKIDHSLGTLKKRRQELEKEREDKERLLHGYAAYRGQLHEALLDNTDRYALQCAEGCAKQDLEGSLFVIQGWVPSTRVERLEKVAAARGIFCEEIAIEEGDTVPTFLENEGAAKIGEDLVHIYDTPSIEDKDPSLWVLLSFSLFFAFIVGDGGYGLLFLAALLFVRYRLRNKEKPPLYSRMLTLGTLLFTACIVWGVLTTSFFGLSFPYDSPLRKVSLMTWLAEKKMAYHLVREDATYQEVVKSHPDVAPLKDPKEILLSAPPVISQFSDVILMELALLIGVVHILLSMLRYLKRNPAMLGWMAVVIGGYLYFPSYLNATSLVNILTGIPPETVAKEGLYLLMGGALFATVASLYYNRALGLLEPMTGIQIFADILSYLRLYALGLAGGIVSATVNELAGSVMAVFGLGILLFGHLINMALALMGGVIHGLRLNFIEWYHYSFIGGGKQFNPLRLLKK